MHGFIIATDDQQLPTTFFKHVSTFIFCFPLSSPYVIKVLSGSFVYSLMTCKILSFSIDPVGTYIIVRTVMLLVSLSFLCSGSSLASV